MKRGMNFNGMETFSFGAENKLRIFPPNTYKFKPKDHIVLDDMQECILDNLWYQYNNKRDEKGYFLSILNSLSEYFNMINGKIPSSENIEIPEVKPLYILYDGKTPGIYTTFEKIIEAKEAAKYTGGASWKKYTNIEEALSLARTMIGINYYIEPEAKEYINKQKLAQSKIASKQIPIKKTIEEGQTSSKKPEGQTSSTKPKEEELQKYGSYKQCLIQGGDPLDGEYIDQKIDAKMEDARNSIISEIKEQVLREVRVEFTENFYELKTQYEEKFKNFEDDYFLKFDTKTDDTMEDSQLPE
jgi:hypothetical protein